MAIAVLTCLSAPARMRDGDTLLPPPYLRTATHGETNGNQGDDFLTVGGLVETRVEAFGNSWKMNADCDDVQMQNSDPCSCPDAQVYEVCGSVCNQTCRSLSLPDTGCDGVCEEGCFCPRGLFLSDAGECVPPQHCSCHHNGEIFEPNDMIGDHHSICRAALTLLPSSTAAL